MTWKPRSLETIVSLCLKNNIDPPINHIATTLQIDPEQVKAEVARKLSNAAAYPVAPEPIGEGK